MANKNVEIMRGNPEVAVRKLAIPIMISMILTASYNIVDGIWIAGLGEVAIAAVGFVTPIFMILNGVSVGLGNGATSSISRFVGAHDKENVNESAMHSLLIFLVASIGLTIFLLAIQEPVLQLYGAKGEALNQALQYSTPLFGGLIAFIFSNGVSGILRGEGDMKRAMYAVLVSVILNALFDPIFIYVLNFKVAGAAYATILSSAISAVVILYWILIKKDTYADIHFKDFKYKGAIVKDILVVGIPASLDMVMMSIAVALYMSFISTIAGDYGIAVYTSGQRLYLFAIMPLTAIGSAVTAVVGSAFGARNGDYISRAHKFGAKFGIAFGTVITLILVIFADPLSVMFAYTPETAYLVPGIVLFLRVATLCLPLTGAGMASSFFYQGIGKGVLSLFFTILREIIFAVILTYYFGIFLGMGLLGIWIGLALGRSIASVINYIAGRYTIRKIREDIGT
ncbi:MAG: MATE family efflux transporter [Methanobrevibacter sp.]|uniref:MATE family efflux transporter n=1 Tax=Methanobrevibacter sp. TaxID=66852 RepID=UPI0026E00FC9|nr:MATE family efflux transporter [Methanobrevibacter sp.]MDO5848348.1 MATE family efflux transporter [Methanobrevibacter sp.]